jgi:dipeptidyl aminopeptidase/acylaminoacyl peptidase
MVYLRHLIIFTLLVCLRGFGQITHAQSAAAGVEAIPGAQNPQLGPSSSKIAFLRQYDNASNLLIYDVNDKTIRRFLPDGENTVTDFRWLRENKIGCVVSRQGTDIVQLFVIDIDTGARITADIDPCWHIHIFSSHNATAFSVSVIRQKGSKHPDLYSVDIDTGSTRLAMKNPGNITAWTCDTNGTPIFATGINLGQRTFYMIDPENRRLRLMASSSRINAICHVYSNAGRSDRKYMFSNLTSNTVSLYELMPDGEQKLIYGNEEFDINSAFMDDFGRVLAIAHALNGDEYYFIDEDDNIIRRILRYFKGKNIKIISSDGNDRAAIVDVSDIGGGQKIYYYDDISNSSILLYRGQGFENDVFRTETFKFKARDGLGISGYITYPRNALKAPLPAVVLVHGGPWERDYSTPIPIARLLAHWGAAVVRINFRGSIGFGKAFEDAGDKQWGQAMQNDLEDGVAELVKNGVIDRDAVAIMGYSYGGYAAVQGIINEPKLYRCAISISGVFDLYDYMANPPTQHALEIQNTYYKIGDPKQDAEALRKYSPFFNYEKIQTPLMIFKGAKDYRNANINLMPLVYNLNRRGIECIYKVFDDEDHVMVRNENLLYMNSKFLYFLKKYIHLNGPPRPGSPRRNMPRVANFDQINLTTDPVRRSRRQRNRCKKETQSL